MIAYYDSTTNSDSEFVFIYVMETIWRWSTRDTSDESYEVLQRKKVKENTKKTFDWNQSEWVKFFFKEKMSNVILKMVKRKNEFELIIFFISEHIRLYSIFNEATIRLVSTFNIDLLILKSFTFV